jgi:hypothetical protein
MKWKLIGLCGVFLAWGAIAQTTLPLDVARFVERRDGCDHFRGEEPYDEERRKFLHQRMLELCVGTDKQLSELKKKYRSNRAVMAKLNEYEVQIESPGGK